MGIANKVLGLLGLGALVVAFNLGGVSGCGSGSSSGGSGTVTEEQVNEMGSAGTTAALEAISIALGGGGGALTTSTSGGDIQAAIKNAISITGIGSCATGSIPTFSSSPTPVTINGSEIRCSDGSVGSGSCAAQFLITSLTSSSELVLVMDCTNLVVPIEPETSGETACEDVTLNGEVGLEATISSSGSTFTDDINLSSDSLTVSLASGLSCGVNYNVSETVSVDSDTGGGTISADGCLSACGSAFSASGSDAF
jgi:hypothetical protein